ncbi:MAG: type II toxin-antitoxin system VapC family toxin [Hyphomicrobiales bacterium]|nr:type II toxin-antitoxin system VapC family toxin [Hyphomicrobiales bacterium]
MVVHSSMAAAWFLPDEQNEMADSLMAHLGITPGRVPPLFWFETRSLFSMAERRGRLKSGDAAFSMAQLRNLSLEDAGSGDDHLILHLATKHRLTGYDASYVALAIREGRALATLDKRLAHAARLEKADLIGPLRE